MNQLCVRESVALSKRVIVSPLTTVIVGPGLVSFQPGCEPTMSPFNQILKLSPVAEAELEGPDLTSERIVGLATSGERIMISRKQISR